MSTLWGIALACALFFVPIANAQKTHVVGEYSQDFRQELPEAPKPKPHAFNKRLLIAAEFALAGAKTFDAIETRRALDHGGMEFNPVFGKHPSPGRQAAVNVLYFVSESALFYATEHSRHPWIRWAGRISLGITVQEHIRLGTCAAQSQRAGGSCQMFSSFDVSLVSRALDEFRTLQNRGRFTSRRL